MADVSVPGHAEAAAAKWLTDNGYGDNLNEVVTNGPTALFWYVASLLAAYKEQS